MNDQLTDDISHQKLNKDEITHHNFLTVLRNSKTQILEHEKDFTFINVYLRLCIS
jgi:hypothetical protein